MSPKSPRVLYWTFTVLLCLPMVASGLGFLLTPPPIAQGLAHLGYPLYLARFLGAAKLLAVLAIAAGTYPRIKEWAYAGLAFLFLGAAYSHLCSGETAKAGSPLALTIVLIISHALWKRAPGDPRGA